jgi:3-keto-disaccharide hydrolase
MRHCILQILPLALLAYAWTATPADDLKPEEGYTLLFNGKDLTGWEHGYCPPGTKPNDENLDGKTASKNKIFTVENGLLVASGKALRAVYTSKEFNKDFHLKFEFRTPADNKKNNSGLFLRGPQLQLDGTNVGGLTNVFKNIKNFREGDWNEIDVMVKGGIITNTVNGKLLSEKDVLELTLKEGKPAAKLNGQAIEVTAINCMAGAEAICKCNGELIGKPMKIPAKGVIGLQSEIGKFEFRQIRIKELP